MWEYSKRDEALRDWKWVVFPPSIALNLNGGSAITMITIIARPWAGIDEAGGGLGRKRENGGKSTNVENAITVSYFLVVSTELWAGPKSESN